MWLCIRLAVPPRQPAPLAAGLQLGPLHQTYDTIDEAGYTQCSQVMPYPGTVVGALAELEALPDEPCKSDTWGRRPDHQCIKSRNIVKILLYK